MPDLSDTNRPTNRANFRQGKNAADLESDGWALDAAFDTLILNPTDEGFHVLTEALERHNQSLHKVWEEERKAVTAVWADLDATPITLDGVTRTIAEHRKILKAEKNS